MADPLFDNASRYKLNPEGTMMAARIDQYLRPFYEKYDAADLSFLIMEASAHAAACARFKLEREERERAERHQLPPAQRFVQRAPQVANWAFNVPPNNEQFAAELQAAFNQIPVAQEPEDDAEDVQF